MVYELFDVPHDPNSGAGGWKAAVGGIRRTKESCAIGGTGGSNTCSYTGSGTKPHGISVEMTGSGARVEPTVLLEALARRHLLSYRDTKSGPSAGTGLSADGGQWYLKGKATCV